MTDFFVSYTQSDRAWAEWIAWVLREAGYKTIVQAWDFRPGNNFVAEMQRAAVGSKRTIAVLSPEYLKSLFAMVEWGAAFAADPDGSQGKLVPVVVREVEPGSLGLLQAVIHISLVGLHEAPAREALVLGLVPGPIHPETVRFPGAHLFPGSSSEPLDPKVAGSALAALPLDDIPKPGPLPVGSRMPLASNPLFVGREEDLRTLARQLKAGGTSAVGQVEIAAATGLGGIGKTQLASEFVHRYGQYFAGGVFWMSFADPASVPVEVADCGRGLGLHSSFDALTTEQQVRLVEEAWQRPLPRLLVFDNCEEEGLLQRWRPRFGEARILVTSRRAEWDAALNVKAVPITTLPRPVSVELLQRFRPDVSPTEEPLLDEIANELGDLPLALHLAGSFLKMYRSSTFGGLNSYLEALRKTDPLSHPSLQGRGAGLLPTRHAADVGRTFALSFERLDPSQAADALAIQLLERAAWFAPGEPIPRNLLLRSAAVDVEGLSAALDAEDAIRRLIDLGLVEVDERKDPRMHRLVSSWARGAGEGNQAREAVESAMIAEAEDLNKVANPALLRSWFPHLRVVADRAGERKDHAAARLAEELGIHLWREGDYSAARCYLEIAVAMVEATSGTGRPETARAWSSLGRVLHSQGEYSKAESAYEKSLAIRERTLGWEHPETAETLNDLGVLLHYQGHHEKARLRAESSLAIREKVLGPEHPETAISLANLGNLLRAQGNLLESRRVSERALAIREKIFGPTHPSTATSLGNLGSLLRDQGDFSGARQHAERALAIKEKVLGPEHPDTATSLGNLGSVLQEQGDFSGARQYAERALAIKEKVLGPEHPDTATSLGNLGSVLQDQGDFSGARQYTERALAIKEKVLGPEHPDTATSLGNLGSLLQDQGDFSGARQYAERALAIKEKVLGLEHPDTATSLGNLGSVLQDQGDFSGARQYAERALAITEKVLGPEHPDTAKDVENLGSILQAQGDLSGARQNVERALAIRERSLGPEHPATARSLMYLGSLLFNAGNFGKARGFLERAARIFHANLGSSHPDTKEARWSLGQLPGARQVRKARHKKKS